jgi:hypothetical protein
MSPDWREGSPDDYYDSIPQGGNATTDETPSMYI